MGEPDGGSTPVDDHPAYGYAAIGRDGRRGAEFHPGGRLSAARLTSNAAERGVAADGASRIIVHARRAAYRGAAALPPAHQRSRS